MKKIGDALTLMVIVCFLGFIAFSFYSMQMSGLMVARFLTYLVFGLFLPGYLLARKVASKDNSSELYAFSLLFGIAWSLAFYFFDFLFFVPLFHKYVFLILGGPLLSIPAIVLLVSDIKKGDRTKASFIVRNSMIWLLLGTLGLSFAATALRSGISAQIVGMSEGYHDMVWNIGNTACIGLKWPTDNMYYLGKTLGSNIYANIFRTAAAKFVGSSAAETMYIFSPLIMIPFLVFSLDSLGLTVLKKMNARGKKKHSLFYVFVFLFVGYFSRAFLYAYDIRGMYKLSYSSYVLVGISNLLYVPNGIDLAVPVCALVVILICKYFSDAKLKKSSILSIFIASLVLSGAKYVFTICIIGALVGVLLFMVFLKRKDKCFKKIFVSLGVMAIAFLISYYGVVVRGTVYQVATDQSQVEYYSSQDGAYSSARKEYVDYLDKEDFSYLIVTSDNNTNQQLIVREAENGVYYLGGDTLKAERITESDALTYINSCEIDTSGIIGGAGGVLTSNLRNYTSVVKACGFIRCFDQERGREMICFFGKENPVSKSVSSDNSVISQLFVSGGNGTEYVFQASYSSLAVNEAMKSTEVFKWLMSSINTSNISSKVYLLLLIPLMFFLCRPVTALPFIFWVFDKIRHLKEIDWFMMFLTAIPICGLGAYFILSVNGFSQVYFMLCAVIFVDVIGVKWICDHYSGFHRTGKVALVAMIIVGCFSHLGIYGYYAGRGLTQLKRVYTHEYAEMMPGEDYITSYEEEAMIWLRDNTPKSSVIAVNRQRKKVYAQETERAIPNDYSARYYYYSAYAERQTFLGAWAYTPRTQEMQSMLQARLVVNNALFNPLCKNRRALMESNGISYLVASNYVGTGMDLQDPDLECVFRNRDIAIYALKK